MSKLDTAIAQAEAEGLAWMIEADTAWIIEADTEQLGKTYDAELNQFIYEDTEIQWLGVWSGEGNTPAAALLAALVAYYEAKEAEDE